MTSVEAAKSIVSIQPTPHPSTVMSPGKVIGRHLYLHVTALNLAPPLEQRLLAQASARLPDSARAFNVVRFDPRESSVALLDYQDFFTEAFPILDQSWKVAVATGHVTHRTYVDSLNPPVLHRKELLLAPDDPHRPEFARLTAELESLGFFDDPVRIGFRVQWQKLLRDRGFRVSGHSLLPIGNEEPADAVDVCAPGEIEVARHLTALTRSNFSAPIQLLGRFALIEKGATIFDYGCGKGDDVRGLQDNGVTASGWDPYYASHEPIVPATIVNLGFVINVIEDPIERRDALMRAYGLAQELLVVSTMVASEDAYRGRPFADGILTGRNTFQKYYTQGELHEYLLDVLGEEPVSAAPGIFLVFRNKDAEQRFQVARYRSALRLRPSTLVPKQRSVPQPPTGTSHQRDQYTVHHQLLDALWKQCLELGREPEAEEIANLPEITAALGSLRKALTCTFNHHDTAQFEQARRQRSEDLLVMLALRLFQKRQPYKRLEPALQRDVRAFFHDYNSALEKARILLSEVANPPLLKAACEVAADHGLGWLEGQQSLQLHASLLSRLPSVLRVYVGCAGIVYGDPAQADLVKIHINSGKVSLLNFDNFLGSALPRMTKRIKINLRSQEMQIFEYGEEFHPPFLYLKSRYINEEIQGYAEQVAFDASLQALGLFDLAGFGPSSEDFLKRLLDARWVVDGFQFKRVHYEPDLDAQCGRFFTYRQLIECGETQKKLNIPNSPKVAESYTALYDLARTILDPVVEYFGGIELTFAFCSHELARHIPRGIAPELDQHASNERKRNGAPECPRLGAAVDFIVRDENMRGVMEWIEETLPFDRLYFYGDDRPIHVSYGPDNKREVVEMVDGPRGRRIPRVRTSKSRPKTP